MGCVRAMLIGLLGSLFWLHMRVSAQEQTLPHATPPSQQMSVTFENGLLSVSAQNVVMSRMLEEIASKAQVQFILAEGVREASISAELTKVSFGEALRQLLLSYDTFFFYAPNGRTESSLRAVWVYPPGTASTMSPFLSRSGQVARRSRRTWEMRMRTRELKRMKL